MQEGVRWPPLGRSQGTSSAVTAACLCHHSSPFCLLILSYLSKELMPLTDPAKSERRSAVGRVNKLKTVLADGSCTQEIICLFCIFSEWLQMGFSEGAMWEWVYFDVTLLRRLNDSNLEMSQLWALRHSLWSKMFQLYIGNKFIPLNSILKGRI